MSFWSVIFPYSRQQRQTVSQLDCDVQQKVDFIQPAMASSVVGLRRSSKELPKVKLAPKKRSWSLFGGLLPVWSTTAFRIPAKPLHLRSMLSKSMRCIKNCNACSWHWSRERTQFFSMTMPNRTSHNQYFKSWTQWATEFCLICHIHLISHQLTTTSSSIWTTFCSENAFTTSRSQKIFSKSSLNSKAWIFML